MPWPILAHQAPVLPLKWWRPAAFNGTALVIGSIAPDFEYLTVEVPTDSAFPHSLAGQFLFCLPVTMAIVVLIGWLHLGNVISARMGGRFTWLADAATDVMAKGGWWKAVGSALIGSCSHVAFDHVTHAWIPLMLPAVRYRVGSLVFGATAISQLAASGEGALLSLLFLSRLARRSARVPVPRKPGGTIIVAFAAIGVGVGIVHSLPLIRSPDAYFDAGAFYVWGAVGFEVACGLALGVLLAAVLLVARDLLKPNGAAPRPSTTPESVVGK